MKVAQSCPIVCKPMACSLPGSSVHGILQARILEWVAISFSSRSSDPGIEHGSLALQAYSLLAELPGKPLKKEERKKERKWSRSVRSNFLWPHGHQAPPSMGFSRQEYWSGLPFPCPGNFLTQGSNPGLPHCRQTFYCLSHQGSHERKTWI